MPETQGAASVAVATALEVAGVPPRYLGCTLSSFERRQGTAKAMAAATRMAGEAAPQGSLILLGRPGAGKTHLAVAILAERAGRWLQDFPEGFREVEGAIITRPAFRSRFAGVPALLDEVREAARRDSPDPLRPLKDAPLLVLDDLGREKATEWAVERLYVLLDHRYGACLPTVVTTNFGMDELAERGYTAMLSRLLEGGQAIRLTASDYRVEAVR